MLDLEKGELLFAEGESSKSMYFVKSGILRIYKKKGNANIEVATVNAGQVLGELAFLDGLPRSATAEALTHCQLVEISGKTFTEVVKATPDWLKLLLKTIVSRLRSASTRIRQLEEASLAVDYSGKGGKRSTHYVYLSPYDVLKTFSSVLLVAAHHGEKKDNGVTVRAGLLQRYAHQIIGIPVAKITTLIDVLTDMNLLEKNDDGGNEMALVDIDFLEKSVTYLNEENLCEPSKRRDMTVRGFMIMSLIAKYLHQSPDGKTLEANE